MRRQRNFASNLCSQFITTNKSTILFLPSTHANLQHTYKLWTKFNFFTFTCGYTLFKNTLTSWGNLYHSTHCTSLTFFSTSYNLLITLLKTLKHFNKRRYARVRMTSRPSFWTGALLSVIATNLFWGSTLQRLDWFTTLSILTDISVFLFICYMLIFLRTAYLTLNHLRPTSRETNKIRRGLSTTYKIIYTYIVRP